MDATPSYQRLDPDGTGRTTGSAVLVEVLGPLRVRAAGRDVELPTSRKSRAVLGYVVLAGGAAVRRSTVAGLLWDRVPEEQARNNLRQALSDLTGMLRLHGLDLIAATRDELRLHDANCQTDLEVLERSSGRSKAPVAAEPLVVLQDLDGLSSSFDHWLAEERARTENRVRAVFEARLDELGDEQASAPSRLAVARELLSFDPTHERAWRVVMAALADMGDVGGALREYGACEAAFRRLLSAAPSSETRQLRDAIRLASAPSSARGWATAPPFEPAERFPSIAVLPFFGTATTPDHALVVDGVVEGIIHNLSGLGELFVIARGTALTYAGRPADPRDVGRDLGVRYVLTGRFVSRGDRIRISTELAETAGGRLVKSNRHDLVASEMFEVQDRVAAEVVAAIAPTVRAQELERARRKSPASLTAYDLLLRGLDRMYVLEKGIFEEGGDLLRRSIALDPGFATTRSYCATWHNFRVAQGWSPDPQADALAADAEASEALENDHNDAVALAIRGQTLSFTLRDYSGARDLLDQATAAGPSCPIAWALSSATHGWTGDGARAVEDAMRAIRLSPQDPFAFFAEHMLSQGHYVSGDYGEAIRWGRRAATRNPRLTSNLRTLSAALVAADELSAAREVASRVLRIEPAFRVSRFVKRTPFHPCIREEHAARLRRAGLPD